MYAALGVLAGGQLIETDRADLVAVYEGQTATKTDAVVDRALGGVLFIDEAYSLDESQHGGPNFGREAIDALVKRMEDDRGNLIVIVAGYPDLMGRFPRR
jgi:stage V sporulation protein K